MHATPVTVVPLAICQRHLPALLLILVGAMAAIPSASAACPTTFPTLPEVVIVEAPEPPLPVVRVPLRTREVNGEVRLENVYGTPEIIKPRFQPVVEAHSVAGTNSACWRITRVEVRLEVETARLEVPEEFADNACLYIGALVSALEDHNRIHMSMREFWERVRPRISQHLAEFSAASGNDETAVTQAFNAWLKPRLLGLVETLHAEDGGPRPPPVNAGFEAGQRACPKFLDELVRFKEAQQPGRRRVPI
jgi:hypothetical protein